MPDLLSVEDYDIILDALDDEDTNTILKYFQKFELKPESELLDAPRYGNNDIEIYTYLDYILSHNLTDVIDIFIDELNLEITDDTLTHSLKLHNINTYNYLCGLGYIPQEGTLKYVVQTCNSSIVDSILDKETELIEYLDEDDIEYIYDIFEDISEETVETISVLLNYGIDISLFKNMLISLKENVKVNANNSKYDNLDIVNEIIDLLESNGL
jgi:hypothetical protein